MLLVVLAGCWLAGSGTVLYSSVEWVQVQVR